MFIIFGYKMCMKFNNPYIYLNQIESVLCPNLWNQEEVQPWPLVDSLLPPCNDHELSGADPGPTKQSKLSLATTGNCLISSGC